MRRSFLVAVVMASSVPSYGSPAIGRDDSTRRTAESVPLAFAVRSVADALPTVTPSPSPPPRSLRWPFGRSARTPSPSPTPVSTPSPTLAPEPAPTPTPSPSPTATPPHLTPGLFVAPSSAPSPEPTSAPTRSDRAYNLIGGTWSCETMTGRSLTHVFAVHGEDAIVMQSLALSRSGKEQVDETYFFDRAHDRWSVAIGSNIYAGSAAPWNGRKWIFDSPVAAKTRGKVSRLVYDDLGDDAFRRDFQVPDAGTWHTVLLETCRRARKPTPAPSEAQ